MPEVPSSLTQSAPEEYRKLENCVTAAESWPRATKPYTSPLLDSWICFAAASSSSSVVGTAIPA